MSLNDFCFCTSCEFHNISLSSKYNPQVAEKLFSNALKIGHNEVHISTAIHLVELCGVKEKIKPKFHRTLVHLVHRFTVPFASHTHTHVIYKVYTQEENVVNDSNPLLWAELLRFASPTNRRRNSRPMGSRHYLRFHLAEALVEIRPVGKRRRKWNLYKVG